MGRYQDELTRSMKMLAENSRVLFLGQAVEVPGTAMHNTLVDVGIDKLIELPVEEDFQMGIANGLAIAGYIPISIFPRWNFLLLATNQIVNHLDKFSDLSMLEIQPKVIIRTGIGSIMPLNPGSQHTGDFTEAFQKMCSTINVVRLDTADQIYPEYESALTRDDGTSTILVEWGDKYNE